MKALWGSAVLLVGAAACWAPRPITPSRGPTLLVTNRGLDHLVVYAAVGRLVTVMPNETRCVYLRRADQEQALEYSIEGQSYETRVFDPATPDGAWRLEVGTLPKYDAAMLRPVDRQCSPAARQVTVP